MKKHVLIYLFILFIVPISVLAEETIPINTTIEDIANPTDIIVTYQIKENYENEKYVENVPKEVEVNFSEEDVINNTLQKEVFIDFSETIFPVPGIYRYGLLQKSINIKGIPRNTKMYEIFVNVERNEEGVLVTEVNPLVVNLDDIAKESITYINKANFSMITIKNEVDGDFKIYDQNTYFKYKISIKGRVGSTYTIEGQDKYVTWEDERIKTTDVYTITEKDNYVYIYLKGNQEVTIGVNEKGFYEIPFNTEYSIKKINGYSWQTYINAEEISEKTFSTTEEKNECLIVNKRDYDNPYTGFFYDIMPYLLILTIISMSYVFGVFLETRKKKM